MEIISVMEEMFGFFLGRVLFGIVFGTIATIVLVLFLNMFVLPFTCGGLKGIARARARGTVVMARLIKTRSDNEDNIYTGIYEYEVCRRKYKYSIAFCSWPPTHLELMWRRRPSTARVSMKLGRVEDEWIAIFIVSSIILAIVACFL